MQVWQIIMPFFCVTKVVVLSKKTTYSYNRGYTTHYRGACKYHERVHTLLVKCMRDCRKSVYDTIKGLFFFHVSCFFGIFGLLTFLSVIFHFLFFECLSSDIDIWLQVVNKLVRIPPPSSCLPFRSQPCWSWTWWGGSWQPKLFCFLFWKRNG